MIIHSQSVSRCSSAMRCRFSLRKGIRRRKKSESVRHVLVLRGISQFAMKAFFAIKAPFRTERESGIVQAVHPSIHQAAESRAKI